MNHNIILQNANLRAKYARIATIVFAGTLAGCFSDKGTDGGDENPDTTSIADSAFIAVGMSDFASGALGFMQSSDSSLHTSSVAVHNDLALVAQGERLYVLERFGADNIMRIDPVTDKVVYQESFEDNSNPTDLVEIDSTLAWVSMGSASYMLGIDPATGKETKRIDLSAYAVEGQGSPNAEALTICGSKLIVMIQRLEDWAPNLPGLLLVADAQTGNVEDTIALHFANPAAMVCLGSTQNDLFVATAGVLPWDGAIVPDSSRGVERVNIATGTSTVLTTDVQLGGAASAIALDAATGTLYVGVYKSFGDMPVVPIQLSTNLQEVVSVGAPLTGIQDAMGGMVFDQVAGLLVVGDRGTKPGLVTWNGTTTKTVEWGSNLPPSSLAVVYRY